MSMRKNKLLTYCKKHCLSDDEAIKLLHTYLNRKGFRRSKWKAARFGFYADSRIKNNEETAISLVKQIIEQPEYEQALHSFFPYRTLDKQQEIINLCKLLSDVRHRGDLRRVFQQKGFELVERYMGQDNISKYARKNLRETKKYERL